MYIYVIYICIYIIYIYVYMYMYVCIYIYYIYIYVYMYMYVRIYIYRHWQTHITCSTHTLVLSLSQDVEEKRRKDLAKIAEEEARKEELDSLPKFVRVYADKGVFLFWCVCVCVCVCVSVCLCVCVWERREFVHEEELDKPRQLGARLHWQGCMCVHASW